MADYYDPWALNYEQLMRAQPVANTGPINDTMPPYSADPSSAFNAGPSTETRFDPVTGMPIFTQGDFLRYARIPQFAAGGEGGLYNSGTKYVPFKDAADLEAMYQKELLPYINLLGSQQFRTSGGPPIDGSDAPKTFAEYLAQLPDASNAGDASGPFASRSTVDEWIKNNSNMSWNPQSKWVGSYPFDHMSAIGPYPSASNWTFDFGDDGSLRRLRQKTAKKEGSWFDYANSGGQYTPTGQVQKEFWDTNDREFNRNMGIIMTMMAGGAAAGAASAGEAAAGGLTSAGTPISMVGPEAISMSALPEYIAGAGGVMGPAAGGGLLNSLGSKMGETSTSDWLKLGSAGLGALAGASGAGPQTTTSSQSLPPELQALLNNLIPKVQQTSPVLGAATNQLQDTIQGKYLNSNPYLENAVKQQQDQMQNRFGTTLMGSGSFGNANVAEQGFKAMNDSANNMRFQNYEQERNRQMQATSQAPNFNIAPYAPAFSLLGLGGRDTTQTSPGMSTGAGLLGGALMGGQLYNTWFPKANNGYSRTGNYSVDNQEIF